MVVSGLLYHYFNPRIQTDKKQKKLIFYEIIKWYLDKILFHPIYPYPFFNEYWLILENLNNLK